MWGGSAPAHSHRVMFRDAADQHGLPVVCCTTRRRLCPRNPRKRCPLERIPDDFTSPFCLLFRVCSLSAARQQRNSTAGQGELLAQGRSPPVAFSPRTLQKKKKTRWHAVVAQLLCFAGAYSLKARDLGAQTPAESEAGATA